MLDDASIANLAKPILEKAIAPSRIKDIRVAPTADADGIDSLEVIAVTDSLTSGTVRARVDASVEVQRELYRAGEPRYAFVHYTTAAPLEHSEDDDESGL